MTNTSATQIIDTITKTCQNKQIRCLHAIESGSRAWGFSSADSDFDVRMIYCHNQEYYLSIFEQKDTFEFIDNQLFIVPFDIGGWDIKKALVLLYKSNAVIFEWLNSPIIYQSHHPFLKNICAIQDNYFNPKAVFYHYQGMAKNARLALDMTKPIKLKKWFYLLRALLACTWIRTQNKKPPVSIMPMLEILNPSIKKEIEELIIIKANHDENYTHFLSNRLQKLIENLWNDLSADTLATHLPNKTKSDIHPLNQLFRQAIYEY